MQTQATKQALAEDIKREILMDLQRSQSPYPSNTTKQIYLDHNLVESIKREVLMELEIPQQSHLQTQPPNRALVEAIKRDVLALMQTDMRINPESAGRTKNYYQQDRALIDAVKRDVLAQIEAQQEAQEEMYAHPQTQPNVSPSSPPSFQPQNYHIPPDPALIQAVKNSVMADLRMPPVD